MWEYAASSFRLFAGLSPSMDVLAARLRLNIERSWEDLGAVDAAVFRIQKIDFALSRLEGSPCPDVFVWVSRAHGQRAIIILSRVRSTRATDYLAEVVRAMAPWRRDPRVIELSRLAHNAIALSTSSAAS
ncbi:hypothetical protein [Streptomyces sp. NBC_00696]|uniref:hypothetical protein n=1 Tax=Streptomyces sp. NBC_00696 TaxID=2903672 RepID=UPI002E3767B6|nr:hypothetical protein [Streptomyces sp. NBC_00696]